MYDLLIIGAGAAGIMAAISARKTYPKYKICIIEKNVSIGKKITICGAGRGNLTNSQIHIDRFYGENKSFIAHVLNQFKDKQILHFFEDLGVDVYEEEKNGRKKGKIFPITNSAKTFVEILKAELETLKIDIKTNTKVTEISPKTEKFKINIENQDPLNTKYLILSTGGKTYPAVGGSDLGFKLAKSLGHSITRPVPSAVPLESTDHTIKKLAGIKIMAECSSFINGEFIKTDIDEVMFTPYGISGPAILNLSREISIAINRNNIKECFIELNFFPKNTFDSIYNKFEILWQRRPNQHIIVSLLGHLPQKLANGLLEKVHIPANTLNKNLSSSSKKELVKILNKLTIPISNTRSWEQGEFTAGGIRNREVKKTLESKIVKNLYFAGEILDVDGDVGGFNLSWAWSSGNLAGKLP